MREARFVVAIFSGCMVLLAAGLASGQNYPNKPVRIVTTEGGGGADFVGRLIAQRLSASLGQQVIVENRGGSAMIPVQIVARALPDGYTMLMTGNNFWVLPLLESVPYDPVKDFSAITLADKSPNILVVFPSLPVRSVKELIALAKTKPGQLNYGSGSSGTSNHLAAELFKSMAQVNVVRVPYRGNAPALNDLIAGQIQVMFSTPGAAAPHVKSGRVRALATTGRQPSPLAPDLPTVAASGLPGYESEATHGFLAPAKTPANLINKLNYEIVRIVKQVDVGEKFLNAGVVAVGSSPAEYSALIKSEMTRLGKVIKDAGIRAE